ncbi:MAG TPA: class I SAM-dependent methyltransferase [Solirubrobacteraceae bacterium]|nr:class I SAM-dependent methyltransferase [Solirubrobacteraceae bacterium]
MRAAISERARTYRSRYEQFGLRYAALAPMRSLAHRAARLLGETSDSIEAQLLKIEGAQGVLGPAHRAYSGHSPGENRAIWTAWDWSRGGDEWNDTSEPEQWKATLIDEVLLPSRGDARAILEIGPGGGRWSEILQPHAERLVLVDVTERALELCRERLGDAANVEYVLSDGAAFPQVEQDSIDWVWSFDVFVHIAPLDVASYIGEIARVLRPGGTAVIHHSGALQRFPGWRSPMTAVLFATLAREQGLEVARQFDSWSNGRFGVRTNDDVITVLRCPGA